MKLVILKDNKIDKSLARLIKKERLKSIISEMKMLHQHHRNRMIRNYYEQLYVNKMDNLKEMKKKIRNVHSPKIEAEQRSRKYE